MLQDSPGNPPSTPSKPLVTAYILDPQMEHDTENLEGVQKKGNQKYAPKREIGKKWGLFNLEKKWLKGNLLIFFK